MSRSRRWPDARTTGAPATSISPVLLLPDEFTEHHAHGDRISVHDGRGSCDVAFGVKALPVNAEAGIAGELFGEGSLRPPVAVAKRMEGVDLAEVISAAED